MKKGSEAGAWALALARVGAAALAAEARPPGGVGLAAGKALRVETPVAEGAAGDLLIVNRFALRSRDRVISRLHERHQGAVAEAPDEARELLASCARSASHFRRAIVAGGDGTLNRVLSSVLAARLPVRLVPAGTANDLAHEIGLLPAAGARVGAGSSRTVELDVLLANGLPFTTVGYLGFGSDVVQIVNALRRLAWTWPLQVLLGKSIYVLGVAWIGLARALPLYRVRVRSRERELTLETPLVVAANQPRVGGTMSLARGTRNDDGSFRLLVFTQKSGLALLSAIWGLCRGGGPADLGVESFETSAVAVESLDGRSFLFCADGEELVRGTSLELTVHPRRLELELD